MAGKTEVGESHILTKERKQDESMKTERKHLVLFVALLGLCLAVAQPLSAQARRTGRMAQSAQATHNSLTMLRNALNQAGATALSAAQEQQLNDLAGNFKNERKAQSPDSALQSAKKNYDAAILSGNAAEASSAAEQLAKALQVRSTTNLEARATFLAKAYAVLSSDQVNALEGSIGKTGVLRVLRSLIGPMGMGRRLGTRAAL